MTARQRINVIFLSIVCSVMKKQRKIYVAKKHGNNNVAESGISVT